MRAPYEPSLAWARSAALIIATALMPGACRTLDQEIAAGLDRVARLGPQIPMAPAGIRDALQTRFNRGYYTLRQSMYFGPFWDEPSLTLLDARPFSALGYLTFAGRAIPPGTPRGIIPAGTRVRIEDVDLPTPGTMVGRPNLSPRYNGWLRLRVNHFDTDAAAFHDSVHVVVLPLGMTDLDEITAYLGTLLGDDEEMRTWMEGRSPEVRAAIQEKRPRVGMLYEELVAAMGPPDAVDADVVPEGRREVLTFTGRRVTLVEKVVKEVP